MPAVLNALTPETVVGGSTRQIFELHKDTDFIELRLYVRILGIALTDIDTYVKVDRELPPSVATGPPSSPSKTQEKPKTVLELVYHTLESIHHRISEYFLSNGIQFVNWDYS